MCSPVYGILHPGNLPKSIKAHYTKKLKSYTNKCTIPNSEVMISTALSMLTAQYDEWPMTIKFIEEFDSVAKTSYRKLYPEFLMAEE